MNGFEKQELETQGMMSKLFGSKPGHNALVEINNFLAESTAATELTEEIVSNFIKNWGAKFDSSNIEYRSSMYRKVADHVYISAVSKDDPVFEETRHLAQVLELPEKLQRLADNGAKKVAYFSRCRKIISGEEPLTISEINNVFGYDYEDGYDIRVQVFHDYLNKKFDEIAEHPSADGCVIHHQHAAAKQAEIAVQMPLRALLFQRAIRLCRRSVTRAADGQLHGQHGNAHRQQEDQINTVIYGQPKMLL